jgi:hypothetical protein
MPELWPNDWILHHDNAPAHRPLFKQFLAQKSITELEHPPYSPALAPNASWLFPKIMSALKGRKFWDTENIKRKCENGTESYSTTGIPRMFTTVATSLGQVRNCSRGVL